MATWWSSSMPMAAGWNFAGHKPVLSTHPSCEPLMNSSTTSMSLYLTARNMSSKEGCSSFQELGPLQHLGLTKTTHENVIYQLLATACGWGVWKNFLPIQFVHPKLLLTRAVRLLRAATIRPAHAKPPHPTWVTAVRQIIRCYHPQRFCCYKPATRTWWSWWSPTVPVKLMHVAFQLGRTPDLLCTVS